jgi:hypothetical protein
MISGGSSANWSTWVHQFPRSDARWLRIARPGNRRIATSCCDSSESGAPDLWRTEGHGDSHLGFAATSLLGKAKHVTQLLLRTLPVLAFVVLAGCYRVSHEPPGADYVKFAELAPGLPAFAPGLGTVYVQPSTRPVGPYRSYDHNGKLIATIYMVPEKDLEEHLKIVSDEKTPPVDHWQIHYVKQMHGIDGPHYHITLWHVSAEEAAALK